MSDLLKLDLNGQAITRYEWDTGAWRIDPLHLNETLALQGDGSVVETRDYGTYLKLVTFAPTPDTGDDPSLFVETGETFTLPDGTVIADPRQEDSDAIVDDQDHDGSDDDTLDGSAANDRQHGGDGDDNVDGGDGDDSLYGDQGDDHLDGGAGSDHLSGGVGFDVLVGGAGRDQLKGEGDDDLLDGGDDNDHLDGGAGDDDLLGGGGNDAIKGGQGNDDLDGGDGDDTEDGGPGDDRFEAGHDAGNDRLIGAAGIDTASYAGALAAVKVDLAKGSAASVLTDAGVGQDHLSAIENAVGSDFDDQLVGSTGANRLEGGVGDDQLTGGLGTDTLVGGGGADTFRFLSAKDSGIGARRDVIVDFEHGDRIDLSAIDAMTGGTRNDAFTFLGGTAPTKLNANGALWFVDGVLYASTDADTAPEFEIALTGVTTLTADDLVL